MSRPGRALAALLLMASCTATPQYWKHVPRTAELTGEAMHKAVRLSSHAKMVKFAEILFDFPSTYSYGELAYGTIGYCTKRAPMFHVKGALERELDSLVPAFNSVMRAHGYKVEESAVFNGVGERSADVVVGARVVEMSLNVCHPRILEIPTWVRGGAWMRIEWSVLSRMERKVIFKLVTEGNTFGDVESTSGPAGLLSQALEQAAHRLALDEGFRNAIDPAVDDSPVLAKVPAPAGGRIRLTHVKAFAGDLQSNLAAIRNGFVTLAANDGQGSGFVLGDNLVLTAAHVVAGSRFVKATTPSGRTCYGEVASSNPTRDVALVRLDCPGLTPLPLRTLPIAEGKEVFAIGTPLSDQFQFTVTRGIVSAIRKLGSLDFIQSDATVLPGNSGGPLVDESGNVVGISSSGVTLRSMPVNINLFIPIAALEAYLPVQFE